MSEKIVHPNEFRSFVTTYVCLTNEQNKSDSHLELISEQLNYIRSLKKVTNENENKENLYDISKNPKVCID